MFWNRKLSSSTILLSDLLIQSSAPLSLGQLQWNWCWTHCGSTSVYFIHSFEKEEKVQVICILFTESQTKNILNLYVSKIASCPCPVSYFSCTYTMIYYIYITKSALLAIQWSCTLCILPPLLVAGDRLSVQGLFWTFVICILLFQCQELIKLCSFFISFFREVEGGLAVVAIHFQVPFLKVFCTLYL